MVEYGKRASQRLRSVCLITNRLFNKVIDRRDWEARYINCSGKCVVQRLCVRMFQIAIKRTSSLVARSNVRLLSSSSVKYNVIQELYLKELKNVKLNPITAKDAEGSVRPWTEPVKPKAPEIEAQGNDALRTYQSELVETTANENVTSENGNTEDDWLVLDEVEEDSHSH